MNIGGNLGMLSIGELPTGVKTSDLTWAPLRSYSTELGGLPAPADSPSEVRFFVRRHFGLKCHRHF
jgi:phytepsin